MPDPARIAQAQVLEIPVTVQGEKAVDETGRREPFAESTKTALTFDNGAVLKLQARMKPGESVSLRNEQSGKEIQCKVLEAPKEGQLGYTDLEFVGSVPDFWEGHAEQAEAAGERPEAGVEEPDAETAAEEPETASAEAEAVAEPEDALSAEPFDEKPEPVTDAPPEAVAAQPEAQAPQKTEAAADNSLAMMSSTASEVKLPPVQAPAPEEEPQAQIPKGRLREELVPAHEMVPTTSTAPTISAVPSAPSATVPTGEQIDAALKAMEAPADPNDAADKANLAALMAREARLAKYAALRDKAATQIGHGPAPQGASKGVEAAEGAGVSVEGEAEVEVEAGPPKPPLSERLTTGRNAVIVEIVAGVAIVVALGFVWHAVRGLIIHPSYRPAAVAVAPVKKAVPPNVPPVVAQTLAAPVAKVPAATPTAVTRAPVAKAPAAKATAARPSVVASAPASKIVQPSSARSDSAGDDGPRVVEPAPLSEEPKPEAPVAPKAPENVAAKIVSGPQPPFPSWAKKLDVGSVVKLDAVIDEKGNLGQAKIVSGPRLLERSAEEAVQLWIFEPARLGGKPAASHMILTVEFQR